MPDRLHALRAEAERIMRDEIEDLRKVKEAARIVSDGLVIGHWNQVSFRGGARDVEALRHALKEADDA